MLAQMADQVLRNVAGVDARKRLAMEVNLDGLRDLEPTAAVRKPESRHGVVADSGCERSERAVDRGMGVASSNDHSGSDETGFHDHMVNAAATAVEEIANAMPRSEPAYRGQRLGRLARRRSEIVIEGEHDARRIGDGRPCHLVLEH